MVTPIHFRYLLAIGGPLLSAMLFPLAGNAQLTPEIANPRGCPVGVCNSGDTGRGNSGGSGPSAKKYAIRSYNDGLKAFGNGDYETALDLFLQAAETFSHDKATLRMIAKCHGNLAEEQGIAA